MTLTDEQRHELAILRLATQGGVFAVAVGRPSVDGEFQFALERLQKRRWISLIDVTPIATSEVPGAIYRIFLLSPEALEFLRATAS